MSHSASSQYCPVIDISLTCDAHITYENAVFSDGAVVCHVAVGHQEGIAAHFGHSLAAGLGTPVDGGALTNSHIVTEFHIGHLSVKLEVLRDSSHNGSGENAAILSHSDIIKNRGVGKNLAAVTNLDELVNIGIRADFHIVTNLCIRMNAGKRMNSCAHIFFYFIFSLTILATAVLIVCPDLYAVTLACRKPPVRRRSPMRSSSL